MNTKGIERNIALMLFVLVLIVFSFAERDSKKIKGLYTTAQLLKINASHFSQVAAQPHHIKNPNN